MLPSELSPLSVLGLGLGIWVGTIYFVLRTTIIYKSLNYSLHEIFKPVEMLRSQLARGFQFRGLARSAVPYRMFSSLFQPKNIFDELKTPAVKNLENETSNAGSTAFEELKAEEGESGNKRKLNTVFDIDELIANSRDLQNDQTFALTFDSYAFGETAKHPRDFAKEINITGTNAGRTVEVKFGNVAQALKKLSSVLRENDVPNLKQRQRRHLRPALLHDLKHRRWWRKNFAVKFSHLLSEVQQAKRRGY